MEEITLNNLVLLPNYIGFKFGQRKFLEELQEGHLYAKNYDKYAKEEIITGKGRGDKDEGLLFSSNKVEAYDLVTNELIFVARAKALLPIKPIFCMTVKDINQHPVSLNYPELITSVSFDDRLICDFSTNGQKPSVLIIIDLPEFIKRIKYALEIRNITFEYGLIKYRDTTALYKTNNGIEPNGPFYKNEYFCYQDEFRILINTYVEDHFDLDIGNISDITKLIEDAESIITGLKMKVIINELIELKDDNNTK